MLTFVLFQFFGINFVLFVTIKAQAWSNWTPCQDPATCFKQRIRECSEKGGKCGSPFKEIASIKCNDECLDTRDTKRVLGTGGCRGDCYDAVNVHKREFRCTNPCHVLQSHWCYKPSTCSGTWTPIGQPTDCSVSCGGGTQTQQFACKNTTGHPFYNCEGSDESINKRISRQLSCNSQACPSWGPWNADSECTTTCGGGNQTLRRRCFYKGTESNLCSGNPSTKRTSCNGQTCPSWATWTRETPCSVTCGGGNRTLTTNCVYNGTSSVLCAGATTSFRTKTEQCGNIKCNTSSTTSQPSSTNHSSPNLGSQLNLIYIIAPLSGLLFILLIVVIILIIKNRKKKKENSQAKIFDEVQSSMYTTIDELDGNSNNQIKAPDQKKVKKTPQKSLRKQEKESKLTEADNVNVYDAVNEEAAAAGDNLYEQPDMNNDKNPADNVYDAVNDQNVVQSASNSDMNPNGKNGAMSKVMYSVPNKKKKKKVEGTAKIKEETLSDPKSFELKPVPVKRTSPPKPSDGVNSNPSLYDDTANLPQFQKKSAPIYDSPSVVGREVFTFAGYDVPISPRGQNPQGKAELDNEGYVRPIDTPQFEEVYSNVKTPPAEKPDLREVYDQIQWTPTTPKKNKNLIKKV